MVGVRVRARQRSRHQFDPGQNVSVGLKWIDKYASAPSVEELSIVRRGRVPGAEITARHPLPPGRQPEPAKPVVANAPARAAAAAPSVHWRTSNTHRDAIETAELRRRHEWLLDNGYPVSLEEVLDNLKSEVGYGRDMSREWRRLRTAA